MHVEVRPAKSRYDNPASNTAGGQMAEITTKTNIHLLWEISTAMMQHILRLTEGYTDLLNELKEVKAELAELKGEKPKKPTIHETKYPHMSIITRK